MATTISTIDPDGTQTGDTYTSLSNWEAAVAADITGGNAEHAKCQCSGGTADTDTLTFSGSWVSDATDYIRIYTDLTETYRHNGTYSTGNKYRLEETAKCIRIPVDDVFLYLEGIQLYCTTAGNNRGLEKGSASTGDVRILDCIVRGTPASANCNGIEFYGGSGTCYVINTLVYDFDGTNSTGIHVQTNANVTIYNCTVCDCTEGLDFPSSSGTKTVRNTIANGNDTDWNNTANIDTASYNVSEDATVTGTNALSSTACVFQDEANDDFRLDPTSDGVSDGVDLSADATYSFDVDCLGTDRSTFPDMWCRGFHESVITREIDPNGTASTNCDYTSLSSWESGEAADIDTPGYVSAALCECTGGSADTAKCQITASWTTEDTHYIKIYTDPAGSYRHNGTFPTSGNTYRMAVTLGGNVGIIHWAGPAHIHIIGIAMKDSGTAAHTHGIKWNASTSGRVLRVEDCVIVGPGQATGSNPKIGILYLSGFTGNRYALIRNNLIYDWNDNGIDVSPSLWSTDIYVYNNTVADCGDTGITLGNTGGTHVLRNNVVQNSTTADYGGSTWDTATHNVSEDTTAPGTDAETSYAVTFQDEGSDDFRLDESDGIADSGVDLSAVTYGFSVDAINTSRPQGLGWSRGFYEIAADTGIEIVMGVATAAFSGIAATVAPSGAATVSMNVASAAFSGIGLTVVMGGIVLPMGVASAAFSGIGLTVAPSGTATVSMNVATSDFAAIGATVVPSGTAAVVMGVPEATFAALSATAAASGTATVSMGVAEAAFSAPALTVFIPGVGLTVVMSVASFATIVPPMARVIVPNNPGSTRVYLPRRHPYKRGRLS